AHKTPHNAANSQRKQLRRPNTPTLTPEEIPTRFVSFSVSFVPLRSNLRQSPVRIRNIRCVAARTFSENFRCTHSRAPLVPNLDNLVARFRFGLMRFGWELSR